MIGDIFQPTHLLFLLVIVLLVLGPKRLPEMARSLGRGFRDFREAISGEGHSPMHELDHQPIEPTVPPAAATRASAQRPVAVSVPTTGDPMAAPDPEVATAAAPAPDPVAVTAATPGPTAAAAPAPVSDPMADPSVAPAPAPTPDPVAASAPALTAAPAQDATAAPAEGPTAAPAQDATAAAPGPPPASEPAPGPAPASEPAASQAAKARGERAG